MKITISMDEWWPVYEIDRQSDDNHSVNVDDDVLENWRMAFKVFYRVQREMKEHHEMQLW